MHSTWRTRTNPIVVKSGNKIGPLHANWVLYCVLQERNEQQKILVMHFGIRKCYVDTQRRT